MSNERFILVKRMFNMDETIYGYACFSLLIP